VAEEHTARQRARVGLRAGSWAETPEFRRLADQIRDQAAAPATGERGGRS